MGEYVATVYRSIGKIIVRILSNSYIFTRIDGGLTVTTTNFKPERSWTPIYSEVVTANTAKTAQAVMEHAANKLGKGWTKGF